MNLSPLPVAVPAAATPSPAGPGAPASGSGDNAFARLLQPGAAPAPASSRPAPAGGDAAPGAPAAGTPAPAPSAPDPATAAEEAEAVPPPPLSADPADADGAGSGEDAGAESPWPPLGLESLLGLPVPPAVTTAPAAAAGGAPLPGAGGGLSLPVQPGAAGMPGGSVPSAGAALQPAAASAPGAVNPAPAGAAHDGGSVPLAGLPLEADAFRARLQEAAPALAEAAPPALHAAAFQPAAPLPSLSAAATPAPVEVPGQLDLQAADMAQELGERVEWILDQKLQSARIRISPDHLGTIDVELRMDGERVHAHFVAASAEVRQVLNDGMPRLRELLDAQGLQLGRAGVEAQGRDGGQDGRAADGTALRTAGGPDAGADAGPVTVSSRVPLGLLDTYA